MLRHIVRYLFVPAVSLLLTMAIYSWINKNFFEKTSPVVTSSGQAAIGGSFKLVNQDGKEVSDTDFHGKLMLVYFGFTHCPSICPTDMALITEAMNILGSSASEVSPIFISVDPERDNVSEVKKFLSNFYSGFSGLTGTAEQIAAVANAYKIYYKKADAKDLNEYLMDHSSYIYLMDREGTYLTHFNGEQKASAIAEAIKSNL